MITIPTLISLFNIYGTYNNKYTIRWGVANKSHKLDIKYLKFEKILYRCFESAVLIFFCIPFLSRDSKGGLEAIQWSSKIDFLTFQGLALRKNYRKNSNKILQITLSENKKAKICNIYYLKENKLNIIKIW